MAKQKKLSQKKSSDTSSNSIIYTGISLIAFTCGILASVLVMAAYKVNFQDTTTTESEETLKFKEECLNNNGIWEQKGGERYVCNYETEDESDTCKDNSDCEGWCLADENDQLGEEKMGQCSDYQVLHGCVKFIDQGKVNSICLP